MVDSMPVKLRPKTSSSGGTIFLGVIELVICNAWGFKSGSCAIASSCCCMLLDHLWHCHCDLCRGALYNPEAWRHGLNAHGDFKRTMIARDGARDREK